MLKFSKLVICLGLLFVALSASESSSRTLYPALDVTNKPVLDNRGNCVRTKWLADQCCDPCGFPAPELPPEPRLVETQKTTTYIDIVRQSIYFDIDKDNIDVSDMQRIEKVLNEIKRSAAIRDVKLVGYADRFATNKYNIDLSKRRATNVLNYIRGHGFLNNVTVGFGYFGEEKPVTNCPTNVSIPKQIACLQADRRVDIEMELLREHTETVQEVIVPAYPRPATADVEVYSRPVDPRTIKFNEPPAMPLTSPSQPMLAPFEYQSPKVPVQPVQSININ